ncbi:MAG: DUF6576 domain-containing protein [Phycisphaerales bacterium]
MSPRLPRWWSRVVGDAENPVWWSVPIGSVAGCVVRVHLVFPLVAALWIVRSISPEERGPVFELIRIAAVCLAVGVHEFGRLVAARRAGIDLDAIIAWPLGGLTRAGSDLDASATLRASLGGPTALLASVVGFAGLFVAVGGDPGAILFNPLEFRAVERLVLTDGVLPGAIWLLYAVSAMVLLANLALPMLPLDAGVTLRAVLAPRAGESGSWRATAMIGMIVAFLLGAVGWLAEHTTLIAVASVGAFLSWQELARQRFLRHAGVGWTDPPPLDDESSDAAAPEPAEIDRILEKISVSGMSSLSRTERRTLEQASTGRGDRVE